MSHWKPAFTFKGQDEPGTNAQVFATRDEALKSAASRFMRWTMPTGYLAVETNDPVNYRWDEENGDMTVNCNEQEQSA